VFLLSVLVMPLVEAENAITYSVCFAPRKGVTDLMDGVVRVLFKVPKLGVMVLFFETKQTNP
jgi:hypothetical protein